MIKKFILVIALALPLSIFAQKFGIVDMEQVITNMPEYTSVQSQLQAASDKYKAELDKLQEEMDKKYTEFQALMQDATTPESIKERRLQEVQELDQKIQQFNNTAQQDLVRQQQQLMAPVEQKLMDAIKTVGQEGSYTFIFQKGMTLYDGSTVIDVTNDIKAKLGIK